MKIFLTALALALCLPSVVSAQTLEDAYPRAAMAVFHPTVSQYQIAKKAYEESQAPAAIDDISRDFQCVYAMPPSAALARMDGDETAHVAMEKYAVGTRTVIDVSYMCYQPGVDCARTTISSSGADLVEKFMNGRDTIFETFFRKSGDRVTFKMSYIGPTWGNRDGEATDWYGDCR